MTKSTVYSGTDLVIETTRDRFSYPKGSFVQLEADKDDNVFVVHHRIVEVERPSDPRDKRSKPIKVQEVETKYLRFGRADDLRFAMENLFFESQFSSTIDLKDTTLSEALLVDRLSPDLITAYLSNKESALHKSYTKEGLARIRMPVRSLTNPMSISEKFKALTGFDRIDTSKVKTETINIVSAKVNNRVQDTNYLVMAESLYNNVDPLLVSYLEKKLRESSPKDWRIRIVEGVVRVSMNGDRPAKLYSMLEAIPVNLIVTEVRKDEDSFLEISLERPEQEEVVESFYTKYVPYDDYKVLTEEDDEKKEGDPCEKDGKKGTLKKIGDAMVCMVKESVESDLDLDEVFVEGDPCGEYGQGRLKIIEGKYCCVVSEDRYETSFTDFKTFNPQMKEGDRALDRNNREGILKMIGETFACEVKETTDKTIFKCLSEFEDAMPREGDACEIDSQAGRLMMINGALVCSLNGQPPLGSTGAN